MALTAGSRVGVFEVTGTLGAGGMGEVYRARDTTLKREVALKVLPAALADDADRVARFQREAELLATLNHPHIAAIYGLAQEGPVRALVLELVEGPTLADRIAAGPLPLDEALPLARQIADALEAAHEQGIIHRDLKPANIKLRPDGTVKVLDFGLAKALDQASGVRLQASGAPATQSPTITSPLLTQRGMILGTAAYMSPEQARGREADRRSDIWAFGGVLYEMLTGTRAFPGDEITDTLAAIVRAEPEWAKLPANTPAAIRRVLKRCLEKNAKERLPHIGAARLEIDDALAHPNEETTTPLLAMAGASSPPPRESRVAWAIALLATLGAVAALGKALWPAGAEPEGPTDELIRLEVPVPVDAGSDGRVANVAVSPDGRQLLLTFAEVGVSRQRPGVASAPLYIRSLGDATARPLPGTEGARAPFWSPDGRRAGFFTEDKLKVIELATHAVRPLCDVSGARVAGSWGNDEIVFSAGPGLPLRRVPAAGGTPTPVVESTDTGGRSVVVRPSFLADGRRFVYSTPRGVMLASLDRTGAKPFIDNATGAQVIGRDWVMFWRAATIMVQRFDEPSESIVGEPTAIAEVGLFPDPTLPLHGGAADTIVVQTVTEGRARLAWVDRAGRHLSWIGAPAVQRGVELAPDDLRVVITRGSPTERNIWLLDVRGLERRMTSAPGNEAFPLWSRDGSVVAYAASQRTTSSDYWQIRLLRPDGSSDDLVSTSGLLTSWSADGSHVLSTATYAGTGSDTLVTDLASKSAPTPFLASTSNELQAQFSPDDRWVAYVSQSGDRPEIYVTDFPARRHVLAVTTSGGVQPRWRRDGRELIYMNLDSRLVAVPVTPGSPLAFGAPVTLFEARTLEGPTARPGMNAQYDVSSDGQRFVLNLEQEPQTARLTAVINWRRLVPGDRSP